MRDADKDRRKNRPINNSNPPAKEPVSIHELKQLLMNARADRIEWEKRAKAKEEEAKKVIEQLTEVEQSYTIQAQDLKRKSDENYQLYLSEQSKYTNATLELTKVSEELNFSLSEVSNLQKQVSETLSLYQSEQENYQQTLLLYQTEQTKFSELEASYNEVVSERDKYIILYNEAKKELKFERRSKAGIKGWETRRKKENQKLKQEIAEMVVLLRESLASKDEAINNLYVVAERMDRIQSLVDSVEEDTTNNPVGLINKFKRIWSAIKEILAE